MRNLVCTSLFALALALSVAPAAQAGDGQSHHRHHQHHHHDHRLGSDHAAIKERRTVSVRLNQRVRDEVIPLRRLLDLDRDFRGHKLEKVVVRLKRRHGTERLTLIADGEVIDSRRARRDARVVLRPDSREVLGVTLSRLQLAVDGSAFIRSIDVQLAAPRHGHGPRSAKAKKHWITREELSRLIGAEIARVLTGGGRFDL